MDTHEAPRTAVWHRRDVATFWGVGLSTLDDWLVKGHVRLPVPRRDPGGKPYWLAGEVIDGATAPEQALHPATSVKAAATPPAAVPGVSTMTDREALEFLARR